jgi:hypothetical protein
MVELASGPLVAGACVRPAEWTAEILDLLRDLGLNTLFVTSSEANPKQIPPIAS